MKIIKGKISNDDSIDSISRKNHPVFYTDMDSAIGRILIASQDQHLIRILFHVGQKQNLLSQLRKDYPEETFTENREKNRQILMQLREYFQGTRSRFSVPYRLRGTDFQKAVWNAVAGVPYGQTSSYGEIARRIGNPKASRAVGGANRANPIPIVIPCHRIIGADGSMTGYGGRSGIPLKKKLLELEKKNRKI